MRWPNIDCTFRGCWAQPGKPCIDANGQEMSRCHPGRREAETQDKLRAQRIQDTQELWRAAGLSEAEQRCAAALNRWDGASMLVARLCRRLALARGCLTEGLAKRTAWVEE